MSLYVINAPSEIRSAIEREAYFEAFALAVTYFDYYSYIKLSPYIPEGKLDRISTGKKREELYNRDMIREDTRDKMKKITELRNKLIHPKGDMTLKYRLTEKQKHLAKDSLCCIDKLKNI